MSREPRTPFSLLPTLTLAAILSVAAWLRLWRIAELPPGFHFDEAFEGLEAWRILHEPGYLPVFLTGNFGVPPLNAYANAAGFALAQALGGEAGPTAMRVVAALFGILGVLAIYATAQELRRLEGGARMSTLFPLGAAASLAVMRWHIHFSRMGIEPILVPLVWASAVWLLLRAWRTGSRLIFAMTGAVTAAGMYAYQGAWVIPLLMGAYGLLLYFAPAPATAASQSDAPPVTRSRQLAGLLLAGGVALALVAPLGWFFAQHPDLLWLRPTQLAIVGSTGSPADSSLGHNLWASARMFFPFGVAGDLDPRRNLPGAPALNLWQAIPFALGLAVAAWRVRRPAYAIILLGLLGLLLPGIFSEYAPHFHRILGATAPVALLCGLGLDWLWQRIAAMQPAATRRRYAQSTATQLAATVLAFALLMAGAAASVRDYFVYWAALPDLFYAFDAGLWELGQATAALGDAAGNDPLYITPRGPEHATLAFAWRQLPDRPALQPVTFDGRHIFPLTADVTTAPERYAVIEHEDFRTRLLLPEVLPAAAISEEWTDAGGEVYARLYTRPEGSIAQRPPSVALPAQIGDGIRLAGYDVLPAAPRPGEPLYVQLHWLVDAAPSRDWTVFTHVVNDATGDVVAGHDSRPGAGSLPTPRWQPGWRILDEYEIALPADLPPGSYRLRAGLYADDGARLPQDEAGIDLGSLVLE